MVKRVVELHDMMVNKSYVQLKDFALDRKPWNQGAFVGRGPIRSLEQQDPSQFTPWSFHSLELSLPRTFAPESVCSRELSLPRTCAPILQILQFSEVICY